jgi:2'-5' RNA ligase
MRVFIACDLFHAKIPGVIAEIKKAGAKIKFIEPQNSHITLKFLGEVSGEGVLEIGNIMENIFHGAFPMEAQLNEIGAFPNPRYIRVIWIGVECPELERLQRELDNALNAMGFRRERDFKLHLTIGRIRSAKNKQRLIETVQGLEGLEIGKVMIDSVKLKKSDLTPKGPIYTDLKVVK